MDRSLRNDFPDEHTVKIVEGVVRRLQGPVDRVANLRRQIPGRAGEIVQHMGGINPTAQSQCGGPVKRHCASHVDHKIVVGRTRQRDRISDVAIDFDDIQAAVPVDRGGAADVRERLSLSNQRPR